MPQLQVVKLVTTFYSITLTLKHEVSAIASS